jgi:hypothetical protein
MRPGHPPLFMLMTGFSSAVPSSLRRWQNRKAGFGKDSPFANERGEDMTDVQPNDLSLHENAPSGRLGAAAIAQFYAFADRCIDWAKTTRSVQERGVYVQMGLQWLAAGARLQTLLHFKNHQLVNPASAMEGKRN